MPLTPRPLAPLALRLVEIPGIPRVRGVQAVGLARLPTLIRGGASPLRRAAEQHPAQHRDLLRQLRDPGIGLRERLLGPLGTLTPVRHISGVTGHRREGHVLQNTPSPSNTPRTAPGVSRTKPQPRRRPRLQTHAALTPHVTTGGHSDSARPPTGSPNTYEQLIRPGFDPGQGAEATRRYVRRKASIVVMEHRKREAPDRYPWTQVGISERRYYKLLPLFAQKVNGRYDLDHDDVVDPSVVRFVGTAGTVLYTTVRVGLWRNFFQVNVSLADSYVDGARKPTVMLLHPPLAALTTCVVALNSTPPAGQLDEYPFATLLESIRYDHTGWLLQVVDDEIPPVAHSSTGRAVHERDQSS